MGYHAHLFRHQGATLFLWANITVMRGQSTTIGQQEAIHDVMSEAR